jgi:signal peptidase I
MGAILFSLVVTRLFFFEVFFVSGISMLPTLKHGDVVFATKFIRYEFLSDLDKLNRLDLVLFFSPEDQLLIKRVIGLPGDFYKYHEGRIVVDPNLKPQDTKPSKNETLKVVAVVNGGFIPLEKNSRIPDNYYLLLGDNTAHSHDSRNIGLVSSKRLLGKLRFVFRD